MIALATTIVSGAIGYFKDRQQTKKNERERKDKVEQAKTDAQIKRLQSGDESAAKLDELSIKQRGWKDEYLLILTTLPLGLSFIPDWAHIVDAGFSALDGVPEYYWYALGMIYVDTFGFRRMVRIAFEHWLQKKLTTIK